MKNLVYFFVLLGLSLGKARIVDKNDQNEVKGTRTVNKLFNNVEVYSGKEEPKVNKEKESKVKEKNDPINKVAVIRINSIVGKDSNSESSESYESYESNSVEDGDTTSILVILNDEDNNIDTYYENKVLDYFTKVLESSVGNAKCSCDIKMESSEEDNNEDLEENYKSEERQKEKKRKSNKRKGKLRCGCSYNRSLRDLDTKMQDLDTKLQDLDTTLMLDTKVVFYQDNDKQVVKTFPRDVEEVLSKRYKNDKKAGYGSITLRCTGDRCGILTGRHGDNNIENLMKYFEILVISDPDIELLL